MELDSFVHPVWQLPVHAAERTGGAYIPAAAKYHCFVDDKSLCGKYIQCTDCFDAGITADSDVISQSPQTACKQCYKLWAHRYLPEAAQREEGQNQ